MDDRGLTCIIKAFVAIGPHAVVLKIPHMIGIMIAIVWNTLAVVLRCAARNEIRGRCAALQLAVKLG